MANSQPVDAAIINTFEKQLVRTHLADMSPKYLRLALFYKEHEDALTLLFPNQWIAICYDIIIKEERVFSIGHSIMMLMNTLASIKSQKFIDDAVLVVPTSAKCHNSNTLRPLIYDTTISGERLTGDSLTLDKELSQVSNTNEAYIADRQTAFLTDIASQDSIASKLQQMNITGNVCALKVKTKQALRQHDTHSINKTLGKYFPGFDVKYEIIEEPSVIDIETLSLEGFQYNIKTRQDKKRMQNLIVGFGLPIHACTITDDYVIIIHTIESVSKEVRDEVCRVFEIPPQIPLKFIVHPFQKRIDTIEFPTKYPSLFHESWYEDAETCLKGLRMNNVKHVYLTLRFVMDGHRPPGISLHSTKLHSIMFRIKIEHLHVVHLAFMLHMQRGSNAPKLISHKDSWCQHATIMFQFLSYNGKEHRQYQWSIDDIKEEDLNYYKYMLSESLEVLRPWMNTLPCEEINKPKSEHHFIITGGRYDPSLDPRWSEEGAEEDVDYSDFSSEEDSDNEQSSNDSDDDSDDPMDVSDDDASDLINGREQIFS